MFEKLRRTLRDLRLHTSGNATLLVAVGAPALIGGSGLAVDISQWYMWKREMQYAVDQAALAGAWARSNNSTTVQGTYTTRATQEYDANLSMVGEFDATPSVSLANYGSGTNNSVVVSVTATKALPFSNLLTGNSTTVYVRAQAAFSVGNTFTVCMGALHPTANQAFKFGGSVDGNSACGVGTLSNHPTSAMFEAGSTNNNLGNLVATGGIDMDFSDNGVRYPNTSGMSDPYAALSPPSSTGKPSRTYPEACPIATSGYTTADVTTRQAKVYKYYTKDSGDYELINYTGALRKADTEGYPGTTVQDQVVTSTTSTTAGPSTSDYDRVVNGSNPIYETVTTTTYTTYSDVKVVPPNDGKVRLQPGVYTDIAIICPTIFHQGIYWISGNLDFGQNQVVTGTGGVLFVMTGTAGTIHINSNSNVRLDGISQTQLTTDYGVSASDASKLAGMLLFDKNSTEAMTINGNSDVKLGGTLYVPKRDVKMNGNGAASGVCMMVASMTLEFLGNFNLDNICVPSNANGAINLGGGAATVKLVA